MQIDRTLVALAVDLTAADGADQTVAAVLYDIVRLANSAHVDEPMRLLARGVPGVAVGPLQQ